MMSTIGRLTQSVSSSMKRFFGGLVKQSFWHKFGFQCPKTLHRVKNLSFLPHLMKSTLPWRNIRVSDLQEYLQLSGEQLDDCLVSGDFHLQDYPWLRDVGDELLNYRIEVRQAIPTRLKTAFSWNMNSWKTPKSCRVDPKMRRIKKLLKDGPVLLQETKWHNNQEEILLQHISGLQIVSTNAIRTDNATLSGGAAVLLPAGWTIEQKISLLAGRPVAVLINDRCASFYLVSVCALIRYIGSLSKLSMRGAILRRKVTRSSLGGILTKQIQNVLSFGKSSCPCFLWWMCTLRLPPTYSLEARLRLIVVWFRRTGSAQPSGILR